MDDDAPELVKSECSLKARYTGRMWYVISVGSRPDRDRHLHDSRGRVPFGFRIDWVAFPRRRYGQG